MANKYLKHSLALVLLFATSAAFADSITFFNTGVDQNGVPLAAGATDTHYSLIYNPDGVLETSTAVTPNSAWMGNTGTAGWISNGASGSASASGGYYVYETTLDLTGYDPTTAVLTGSLAADDLISIYLNRTGSPVFSGSGAAFSAWSSFTINSGFVSGVNYVDFLVVNQWGGTGLLVDNTQATAASAVPEPASLLLVATGISGLYLVLARTLRQGNRSAVKS